MNSYITLSNSNEFFVNNKNSNFISKIDQLILKKSYKCALIDFSYVNLINKNLGDLEIFLNNIDPVEGENHSRFLLDIQKTLDNIKKEIDEKLTIISSFHVSDSFDDRTHQNDLNVLTEMIKLLYELYTRLLAYMNENKNKNFKYYGLHLLNTNFFTKKIQKFNLYRNEILDQFYKFNAIIKEIIDLNKNISKSFYLQLNFKLQNQWTCDDFCNYFQNQISNHSEFKMTCIYNNLKNKFELKIPQQLSLVCKLYGDIKINSFFKFEISQDKKSIEFKVPKIFNFIKNMYIHTDIIDEIQINNEKKAILQIINHKGEYTSTCFKQFDRPKYFNINKTLINHISIKITDQENDFIDFETTPILTLNIIQTK